jgi:Gas vesicle synthesis protein GvpL/GvpF
MLYLYALTDAPATVPDRPGVGGSRPAAEHLGGFDAIVSRVSGTTAPTEEAILAHAEIVDQLAAANEAVLPARFGSVFADTAALREVVERRADELQVALDEVRGCVELGLRVLVPNGTAEAPASSGRDYMARRLAALQESERVADTVHAPLAALARVSERRLRVTPHLLLTAAYLVPRTQVDAFRTALAAVERVHPELTLACTGPWPPYSFTTVEAATT